MIIGMAIPKCSEKILITFWIPQIPTCFTVAVKPEIPVRSGRIRA
jgi:hypothetical protein